MPTKVTYREALNQALREEMRRDDQVFLIGEGVAYYQGAFKVSKGFLEEFGSRRVVDTPITELGFPRLAIGAALAGGAPGGGGVAGQPCIPRAEHVLHQSA